METTEVQGEGVVSTFWTFNGELRAVWKLSAFSGMFLLGFVVSILLLSPLWGIIESVNYGTLTMVGAVSISTVFAYVFLERKPLLSVGLTLHRGWLRELCGGWIFAGVLISLLTVTELALGEVRIHPGFLTTESVLGILGRGLFMFALVAYSEEVLVRGYPLQLLDRRIGRIPALLLTSLVFSIMHIMNPGINALALINIFLAGLMLGSAYFLTRSLWLPIGMHYAWNFVQGNVFGFPVSGQYEPSVFISTNTGSELISGGMFGPEGGLLASVVLLLGTAALYHPWVAARLQSPRALDTVGDPGGKESA